MISDTFYFSKDDIDLKLLSHSRYFVLVNLYNYLYHITNKYFKIYYI